VLRDALQQRTGLALNELSMGMSNDFETAIEEGATLVRIGSALFEGVEP
jgi:PLP dependent protein